MPTTLPLFPLLCSEDKDEDEDEGEDDTSSATQKPVRGSSADWYAARRSTMSPSASVDRTNSSSSATSDGG